MKRSLVFAMMMFSLLAGCYRSTTATKTTSGASKVEIQAPGVNIKAGDKGVQIDAPGTRIETGDKGVSVDAPGTKVRVKPDDK